MLHGTYIQTRGTVHDVRYSQHPPLRNHAIKKLWQTKVPWGSKKAARAASPPPCRPSPRARHTRPSRRTRPTWRTGYGLLQDKLPCGKSITLAPYCTIITCNVLLFCYYYFSIYRYDCTYMYLTLTNMYLPTTCTLDTLRTLRRPFVRPRPVLRNLPVRRRRH